MNFEIKKNLKREFGNFEKNVETSFLKCWRNSGTIFEILKKFWKWFQESLWNFLVPFITLSNYFFLFAYCLHGISGNFRWLIFGEKLWINFKTWLKILKNVLPLEFGNWKNYKREFRNFEKNFDIWISKFWKNFWHGFGDFEIFLKHVWKFWKNIIHEFRNSK